MWTVNIVRLRKLNKLLVAHKHNDVGIVLNDEIETLGWLYHANHKTLINYKLNLKLCVYLRCFPLLNSLFVYIWCVACNQSKGVRTTNVENDHGMSFYMWKTPLHIESSQVVCSIDALIATTMMQKRVKRKRDTCELLLPFRLRFVAFGEHLVFIEQMLTVSYDNRYIRFVRIYLYVFFFFSWTIFNNWVDHPFTGRKLTLNNW